MGMESDEVVDVVDVVDLGTRKKRGDCTRRWCVPGCDKMGIIDGLSPSWKGRAFVRRGLSSAIH